MRISFFFLFIITATLTFGQEITIGNDRIRRTLTFDGEVWRTVRFSDKGGHEMLELTSEEFHILPIDGDQGFSIGDFAALGQPETYQSTDTSFVRIVYTPKPEIRDKPAAPDKVQVTYFVVRGESYLRKKIVLEFSAVVMVDRLEVERFVVNRPATGGVNLFSSMDNGLLA